MTTAEKNKKKYRIKYEDRFGDVHCEIIWAYNYVDVGRRLSFPVKEVYWIREEKEPINPYPRFKSK